MTFHSMISLQSNSNSRRKRGPKIVKRNQSSVLKLMTFRCHSHKHTQISDEKWLKPASRNKKKKKKKRKEKILSFHFSLRHKSLPMCAYNNVKVYVWEWCSIYFFVVIQLLWHHLHSFGEKAVDICVSWFIDVPCINFTELFDEHRKRVKRYGKSSIYKFYFSLHAC